MTLWRVLERELAESRGINLRWLDWIAPETAARWRQDHKPAVYAMHTAVINGR